MAVEMKDRMEADNILEVKDLTKYFPVRRTLKQCLHHQKPEAVHAVDHLNLTLRRGEVTGLVGESGCGKSTLARVITNLYSADSGDILFDGRSIVRTKAGQKNLYGTRIQMVFQDPYASLNPRMRIRQMLYEIMAVHHLCSPVEREQTAVHYLELVGLNASYLDSYPAQLSGGQRQRISIARALLVRPELLIADEAITALDVSIQAQIINLLCDLRQELGLSMLFISHDLTVVQYISDKVVVMYLGEIVESSPTEQLFQNPLHPYTEALLRATPKIGDRSMIYEKGMQGEAPSPIHMPAGCRFHTRCPYAVMRCSQEEPRLVDCGGGHFAACFRCVAEQNHG